MGKKKNRRGKRRVKKKEIKAGAEAEAEAEAETQANISFPNIPEEVVVEILLRLPLDSLPRFTCVSKQWHSLVSDIIAKLTGKKMVLVSTRTFYSIDEESRVQHVTTPLETIKSEFSPKLYGSCNGLLLIGIDDDLFLWNPVTRYFKKVLSYEPLADYGFAVVSGLCYDSSTNEYKAVMALTSDDHRGEFVVVGSFRSKSWRRIRFPYKVYTVKSGPVVNGHLHWYCDENSNPFRSLHQILYFNPHTNQFSKVPMPEPRNRSNRKIIFGLGVLDRCLSMVRHHDIPSYSEVNNVEVLAMKEYGMQKSWTKLFSISNLALLSYDKLEPLCYTKDGKALMFMSGCGRSRSVRAYNPIDSSYNEILVQPIRARVEAIMYEESLVTPTGYNWEEEGLRAYVEYYVYSRPYKWIKRRNGYWDRLEIEEKDYEQPKT